MSAEPERRPGRAAQPQPAAHGIERMGVVADLESMRLVGIISSSDLSKPVRRLHEEQVQREGWWGSARSATEVAGAAD